MREMNSALLVSSVRQHELADEVLKAEWAIRESEARFRVLAETVPQKIFTTDATGAASYFNPQWTAFTGLPLKQLVRRGWTQVIHPDDLEEGVRSWKHSLKTGEPFLIEHRLRQSGGQDRWHVSRAVPMRDAEGRRIVMWVGSSTDVDDVKRLDEVLRVRLELEVTLRTAELLSANEQLQGFTYSVAHDLRQQIRGISTNAAIIMSDAADVLNEEHNGTLTRLVDSSKKLSKLVDDLLTYARLGRLEPIKKPIDLTKMTNGIAAFLTEHGLCGTAVQFNVESGLATLGDPILIRIVMENLLSNACKFSSRAENPTVEVGCEGPAFFVRDNGVGFDMEYRNKLFQPFERLHASSGFSGTGIGLANVRRIVEKHGGQVSAKSKPGEGATFYFSLEPPD
jgi:PAS domain S-box-containing protein